MKTKKAERRRIDEVVDAILPQIQARPMIARDLKSPVLGLTCDALIRLEKSGKANYSPFTKKWTAK